MALLSTLPAADGFAMPAEFAPHRATVLIWPVRPGSWGRDPSAAQKAFLDVIREIAKGEDVYLLAGAADLAAAQAAAAGIPRVTVFEIESDDAWARDVGPTFVTDGRTLRGVSWKFNAWGGEVDGLYASWDKDDAVAAALCGKLGHDCYDAGDFVLEGGSIHVDGEGTLLTTEMCLLSEGRNPHMTREQIEEQLKEYLNLEKIIWIKDGIDPEETNGHIDDVACFVKPGEVACIWTEDPENPFYNECQAAYKTLSEATDAKGRKLKVHKLCMPKVPVTIRGDFKIDYVEGTLPREDGDICIASYMNFLIVNGGVIVPQYGDENDALALEQIQAMFPDRKAVGVYTREVVYGGGNIHCITQQQVK